MTILFFSRLFHPHIGGVEKHVLEVGKRLIEKGYRVVVITEKYQSKAESAKVTGEVDGIEIKRIRVCKENFFKKFIIWWELWKLRELIKTADIIHCHDVFFWYLPFRILYPKKPVYTTFHGYEGNIIPTKTAIFMHKLAEKLSRGNICVGHYLKKWYGTRTDFVTYGGVEISNIKYQISNIKKKNDLKRIAFIGRLEEETGIMEYLKALKILKDKGYNIKLTVLGDGTQRAKAEHFCNLNKLDADFKGFVNNVFHYINDTNFVFTSRYLGILEAMVSKRIVFAVYNNPIKKDYLQMALFSDFIIVDSNENIFSKVAYFLKNPGEEKKVVDKAYEWAKNQTWDKMSEMYIKLWYKGEY